MDTPGTFERLVRLIPGGVSAWSVLQLRSHEGHGAIALHRAGERRDIVLHGSTHLEMGMALDRNLSREAWPMVEYILAEFSAILEGKPLPAVLAALGPSNAAELPARCLLRADGDGAVVGRVRSFLVDLGHRSRRNLMRPFGELDIYVGVDRESGKFCVVRRELPMEIEP